MIWNGAIHLRISCVEEISTRIASTHELPTDRSEKKDCQKAVPQIRLNRNTLLRCVSAAIVRAKGPSHLVLEVVNEIIGS